jgi:hypothetical protein
MPQIILRFFPKENIHILRFKPEEEEDDEEEEEDE